MLDSISIPGLFITGTDTGVGKTLIAGAIAQWFGRQGLAVAALKPVATGCVRRREGLVSEDAEFIAHVADVRFPLDIICPVRYAEPLAPAVAAQRAKKPVDWEAVGRSIRIMSKGSDVMVVEGVGGVMVPLDEKHTVLDLMEWLGLPAVVVARPGLGTINHTLLTVSALWAREIKVAGVVINRYTADKLGLAEETSGKAIEKWGKVPVLCVTPEETAKDAVGSGVAAAIRQVDWAGLAGVADLPKT